MNSPDLADSFLAEQNGMLQERSIPLDVSLAMHEWREQCRAARDEPTPAQEREYLALLLAAHDELQNEGNPW